MGVIQEFDLETGEVTRGPEDSEIPDGAPVLRVPSNGRYQPDRVEEPATHEDDQ